MRAIGSRVASVRDLGAPLTGAITFVQRGSMGLVNLNVHLHLIVPDGVFVEEGDGFRFVMRCRPPPTSSRSSIR